MTGTIMNSLPEKNIVNNSPWTFEELNGFTTRRRIIKIGNPAVVWHRAYACGDQSLLDRLKLEIADNFDNFVTKNSNIGAQPYNGSLPNKPIHQRPGNKLDELSSFIKIIYINKIKVAVEIEPFNDFVSLKLIIDFSKYCGDPIDEKLSAFSRLDTTLRSIEEYCVESLNNKNKKEDSDEKIIGSWSNEISQLMIEIETTLFREGGADQQFRALSLTDNFANFIGISIGCFIEKSISKKEETSSSYVAKKLNELENDSLDPGNSFVDELGVSELVKSIENLIGGLNPVFVAKKGECYLQAPENIVVGASREFTVSLLSRKRLLYITSLGGNRSQVFKDEKGEIAGEYLFPLCYLMIAPHRSRWQIGRVIDRIHFLGMFRTAALREYDKIEKAGQSLTKFISDNSNKKISHRVDFSYKELDEDINFSKGLRYRLIWSSYYLKVFHYTIETLDISRLESFQNYKEFISSKFGGRFLTIDQVSSSVNQVDEICRDSNDINNSRNMEELLRSAEIASVVPIAYYSKHVWDFLNDAILTVSKPWSTFTTNVPWIITVIFYILILVKFHIDRSKRSKRFER